MGGKGSGGNGKGVPYEHNPVKQAADPTNIDPKVNSKVMKMGIWLMGLETPDYGDSEAVKRRVMDYLAKCDELEIKPMVNGLCQALDIPRTDFWGIVNDDKRLANWHNGVLTPESRYVMRKAYAFLNTAWETYLVDERGNPVKWIFLGKNYFGMRDQTEHVQIRTDMSPLLTAPEEVAEKYAKMVGKAPDSLPQATLEKVEDIDSAPTR